jgi:hypothetical protein
MITNIILVLLTLIIFSTIIYMYSTQSIKKIKKTNGTETPSSIIDKKEKGTFLVDRDGGSLFYTYEQDKFLDVGTCDSCVSACEIALPIEDVYTGINCKDEEYKNSDTCKGVQGYKIVKLFSKEDYLKMIQDKVKGQKSLTVDECINLVNTSGGKKTRDDEIMSEAINDILDQGFTFKDFFKKRKDTFIMLGAQLGMARVIAIFSHEFSSAAFIVPLIAEGNYYAAGVFTGYEVSKIAVKQIVQSVIQQLTVEGIQNVVPGATEKSIQELTERVGTEVAERAAEEVAERIAASILLASLEVVTEIFDVVGFLQLVGMVLDIWDPCGLNSEMSQDDINSVSDSFDNAFYQQMLAYQGKYPIIFTANLVPEYKFFCNTNKKTDTKILSNLSTLKSENDPCDTYDSFRKKCINDYLGSLKVNQFGLCIGSISDQELADEINALTGASVGSKLYVTQDTIKSAKDIYIDSNEFMNFYNKFFDVIDIALAGENLAVALYIKKYWYIVLLILIIIILIVFLIK